MVAAEVDIMIRESCQSIINGICVYCRVLPFAMTYAHSIVIDRKVTGRSRLDNSHLDNPQPLLIVLSAKFLKIVLLASRWV